MPDNQKPLASSADPSPSSSGSALNDQVRDALSQLQAILGSSDASLFQVAAYQTFVHVIALAMHNAVAEQQQGHILRMALTTSAANAILAGRKEEAEGILELAHSRLASFDLPHLLAEVRTLIETISRELAKQAASAASTPSANESAA